MKIKKITTIAIIIICILGFLYFENNAIVTTEIIIESDKLPHAFDDYTIVQLSDLHGKSFGKDQKALVEKINKIKPDIIVFTGDLIDSRRYNKEKSIKLIKQITKIAPVYYVTGNHECRSGKFDDLEKDLLSNDVNILRNSYKKIKKGQDEIYVLGIDDPLWGYVEGGRLRRMEEVLSSIIKDISSEGSFKILLSHRPERLTTYAKFDIDVIFSGHAHGGQIRLPFIGGLLAPHQGIFPKYTWGKYSKGHSSMIVSRGLGNSLFPQRIFNRPEIIVAQLKKGR